MQRMRLLIVDDNEDIRNILHHLLQSKGYEIDEACDGVEALTLLQRHVYVLVITDYRMPRLNGLALLALIQERWKGLPVLLISSYLSQEHEDLARRYGVYAILRKPLDHMRLFETVTAAVESPSCQGAPCSAKEPLLFKQENDNEMPSMPSF